MKIIAEDIGKKYGKNWIFRHLSFEISEGSKTAITGNNGAGKSTLLQIVSGFLTPSQGRINYGRQNRIDDLKATFIGPYTELIEELTLREFLTFHSKFRESLMPFEEMSSRASLPLDKFIADFSTGMKQRAKLVTAFFFENKFIFFDEPTSNLDQEGFEWWKKELVEKKEETIMIATNQQSEIDVCTNSINLLKSN